MLKEIKDIMQEIVCLTNSLNHKISSKDYFIEDCGCPHDPAKIDLKSGCGAVYLFFYQGEALKIGKANPGSAVRFKYHHYGFSAPSTLARSVCSDAQFIALGVNRTNVKSWLKQNTYRINIQVSGNDIEAATELIEAVLHYQFRPRYEGALNNTAGRQKNRNISGGSGYSSSKLKE